jgi:hypothetical protein
MKKILFISATIFFASCSENISEIDKVVNDFCECQKQMGDLLIEADKIGYDSDPQKFNEISKKASDKSSECQNMVNKFLEGKDDKVVEEFMSKIGKKERC